MEDIDICENISFPDIETFKVKTVRTKPKAAVND